MTAAAPDKPMTSAELRAKVLAAQDQASELVEVPEWDVTLRVVSLTGSDRDRYQQAALQFGRGANGEPVVTGYNMVNASARLVSLSVRGDDGLRVFTDVDVLALGDKSPVALDRVVEVARRLSGLTTEAVEAAKAGFATDPSDISGSV